MGHRFGASRVMQRGTNVFADSAADSQRAWSLPFLFFPRLPLGTDVPENSPGETFGKTGKQSWLGPRGPERSEEWGGLRWQ